MIRPDLEPCPYCAEDVDDVCGPVLRFSNRPIETAKHWYRVVCGRCGASTAEYSDEGRAIRMWNMRDGKGGAK